MACDNAQTAIDTIVSGLGQPNRVSGDAGSVQMPSMSEQIAAANYLSGVCAARQKRTGLRLIRLIPDGTVQRPRRFWR